MAYTAWDSNHFVAADRVTEKWVGAGRISASTPSAPQIAGAPQNLQGGTSHSNLSFARNLHIRYVRVVS